ncbi:hypothetical protein PG984_016281 [Apiospora sp. TS-2023a]
MGIQFKSHGLRFINRESKKDLERKGVCLLKNSNASSKNDAQLGRRAELQQKKELELKKKKDDHQIKHMSLKMMMAAKSSHTTSTITTVRPAPTARPATAARPATSTPDRPIRIMTPGMRSTRVATIKPRRPAPVDHATLTTNTALGLSYLATQSTATITATPAPATTSAPATVSRPATAPRPAPAPRPDTATTTTTTTTPRRSSPVTTPPRSSASPQAKPKARFIHYSLEDSECESNSLPSPPPSRGDDTDNFDDDAGDECIEARPRARFAIPRVRAGDSVKSSSPVEDTRSSIRKQKEAKLQAIIERKRARQAKSRSLGWA